MNRSSAVALLLALVVAGCGKSRNNLAREMCPTMLQASDNDRVQLIDMLSKQGLSYSDAAEAVGSYFRLSGAAPKPATDAEICAAVLTRNKDKQLAWQKSVDQEAARKQREGDAEAARMDAEADALEAQANAVNQPVH